MYEGHQRFFCFKDFFKSPSSQSLLLSLSSHHQLTLSTRACVQQCPLCRAEIQLVSPYGICIFPRPLEQLGILQISRLLFMMSSKLMFLIDQYGYLFISSSHQTFFQNILTNNKTWMNKRPTNGKFILQFAKCSCILS